MANVILAAETIGNSRPWVARIMGLDPKFGLKREFVQGIRDYSRANSARTRGIQTVFCLEDGVYEINLPQSWNKTRREFIQVTDGQEVALDKTKLLKLMEANNA